MGGHILYCTKYIQKININYINDEQSVNFTLKEISSSQPDAVRAKAISYDFNS